MCCSQKYIQLKRRIASHRSTLPPRVLMRSWACERLGLAASGLLLEGSLCNWPIRFWELWVSQSDWPHAKWSWFTCAWWSSSSLVPRLSIFSLPSGMRSKLLQGVTIFQAVLLPKKSGWHEKNSECGILNFFSYKTGFSKSLPNYRSSHFALILKS